MVCFFPYVYTFVCMLLIDVSLHNLLCLDIWGFSFCIAACVKIAAYLLAGIALLAPGSVCTALCNNTEVPLPAVCSDCACG